uniref:Tetratricopeptide repeat protein n=1 Tax=Prevotella sp. GTC17259 TaxID=3236795 RepID=A0AB33J7J1_9BACT
MMKKFILISLLLFAVGRVTACGPMMPVHNYYLFDVYDAKYSYFSFDDQLFEYWKQYTGVAYEENELYSHYPNKYSYSDLFFDEDCAFLMEAARKKGDKDMMAYIRLIAEYSKVSGDLYNQWSYPTQETIEYTNQTLTRMANTATQRLHGRLKAQYCLLLMRANMTMKRYADNIRVWEETGNGLPKGVYRDFCRNIYANALYNLPNDKQAAKHTQRALDIYAEQGDLQSMTWRLLQYRNVAGIRKIYGETPNSPSLIYLIQEFVNGAQETADSEGNKDAVEWVGYVPTYTSEMEQFFELSNRVLREGKAKDPCLWQAANAMLHYIMGNYRRAGDVAERAMMLRGMPRSHDVARSIRLMARARLLPLHGDGTEFIAQEIKWLDRKSELVGSYNRWDEYFWKVKDRLIYTVLVPRYKAMGNKNMQTALMGIPYKEKSVFEPIAYTYNSPHTPWIEEKIQIDSLTASEAISYAKFVYSHPKDALERYAVSNATHDREYYNDLIGSKFLREGRFAEALPYLRKLSMLYINSPQSDYLLWHRDFAAPRWFVCQQDGNQFDYYEIPALAKNYKVAYCEDMLQLQSRYRLAGTDADRCKQSYELAKRYFQASAYGDCWYLTRDTWSAYDSAKTYEKDFAQETLRWLDVCLHYAHDDFQMKQQALYAKAFVLLNVHAKSPSFFWIGKDDIFKYPDLRDVYTQLADFCRQSTLFLDPTITRCDVLRQFMQES